MASSGENKMIKTIASKQAYDIDGSCLNINSSKIKDLYTIGECIDKNEMETESEIVQDIDSGIYYKLNKLESGKKLSYDDFSISIRNDYLNLRKNRDKLYTNIDKGVETFKQEIVNRDGNIFRKSDTLKLLNSSQDFEGLFDIEDNPEESLAIGRIKTTIGPDPELNGENGNYNFIQKKESIVHIPGKLNVDSECNLLQNVFIEENLNVNGGIYLNGNKSVTKISVSLMDNVLLLQKNITSGINIKNLIKKWRSTKQLEINKGEIFINVYSNVLDLPIEYNFPTIIHLNFYTGFQENHIFINKIFEKKTLEASIWNNDILKGVVEATYDNDVLSFNIIKNVESLDKDIINKYNISINLIVDL